MNHKYTDSATECKMPVCTSMYYLVCTTKYEVRCIEHSVSGLKITHTARFARHLYSFHSCHASRLGLSISSSSPSRFLPYATYHNHHQTNIHPSIIGLYYRALTLPVLSFCFPYPLWVVPSTKRFTRRSSSFAPRKMTRCVTVYFVIFHNLHKTNIRDPKRAFCISVSLCAMYLLPADPSKEYLATKATPTGMSWSARSS